MNRFCLIIPIVIAVLLFIAYVAMVASEAMRVAM